MPRLESILLHSASGDGYNDLTSLSAIRRGPCPPLLPSHSLNTLGSSGSFSGSRSEPMAASLILDCCGVDRHGVRSRGSALWRFRSQVVTYCASAAVLCHRTCLTNQSLRLLRRHQLSNASQTWGFDGENRRH